MLYSYGTQVKVEDMGNKTHFGYREVDADAKKNLVNDVFSSVANQYDLMNDLMSLGVHRYWKDYFVNQLALKPHDTILDLACGTGDITQRMHKVTGSTGQFIIADYNAPMLQKGRQHLLDQGILHDAFVVDGHHLPFQADLFDRVVISFGLRNMADQIQVLKKCLHVLKPGGRLAVLEFSQPRPSWFKQVYDWYSFNVIPEIGSWVANDRHSYQYLVESIRMHPDAPKLKAMFMEAGFENSRFEMLTGGVVAIHQGEKPSC